MTQTVMEKTTFNYAMKNIPLPSKDAYRTKLLDKVENFIKRLRWKAYFFLNPTENPNPQSKYQLKSSRSPPQVDELKPFEDDLLDMIQNLKFRPVNSGFQRTLQQDINNINASTKVIASADKTRNLYKLDKDHYEKLLRENITKTYKRTDESTTHDINQELKNIASELNIGDRIETMAEKQAFITLKDHKDNFINNSSCRLINPAKSNMGTVSKQILENINNKVRAHSKVQQWKNSQSVIDWFKGLKDKHLLSFLVFDIVDFYPSITEQLLVDSLDYASQFITITAQDKEIIMHARRSLLFDKGKPWSKRNTASLFDVSMGSYDGAEICELVGLFLLHSLAQKFNNRENTGLYRDDGLAAFKNMGPRTADKTRKKFIEVFEKVGLKITIQSNLKIVDYLDITLNLCNESFYPYRKPENPPLYVNAKSNHPPCILKQIPAAISRRISNLSCNKTEFEKAAPLYDEALKSSGFTEKLQFHENKQSAKRNRPRNILWFNPPYSKTVQTNVGKHFLNLIDKHFVKPNPLCKIINRRNVKVSYSCMPNMKNIVNRHNSKVLRSSDEPNHNNTCNCRKKPDCPLNGACLVSNVVYKATVTADNNELKTYIGMTEKEFKTRFRNHKSSFNNKKYSSATALSKYIWGLKEANINYSIKWSIIKRAGAYRSGGKQCNLCLAEKLCILKADKDNLNKRSELLSKCRHMNKFYAVNIKPP